MSWTRRTLPLAVLLCLPLPAFAQKEYGFDNTKPSGQPYLKPEESVARMKVADGFEVKLFAAEPQVVNPIAMTVDEKGRVWVIECFEYPKRTPKGQMPRDRIVILEDTDGDGVADKRTVFAEGKDFPVSFDMASGLEVGHGGVFVGAPPYLFFIENKDDKPGKFEILLKGFGSQDTHETLNTFQWGPDGRLYGLHGVFTQSEVTAADKPEAQAKVKLNGAVWRYDVKAKQFEVFAEGTSNPWGMDWRNSDGQFILCCCVIPHLFHISPGGIYKRQAGSSYNPYVYSYLNEICDHTFHKESGWAHAGLISLDTPCMPSAYHDRVIFGSIHGCSIKQNVLKKNGSTYTASRADDFLQSGDKNFRPINLRWGHNGEIYCIDWHDQNPCHQALPDSWDYEHGRVYRIVQKGRKPVKPLDLSRWTDLELAMLAFAYRGPDGKHQEAANTVVNRLNAAGMDPFALSPWWTRTALRLLNERAGRLDDAVREFPRERFAPREAYQLGAFDEKLALKWLDESFRQEAWQAKSREGIPGTYRGMREPVVALLGEIGPLSDQALERLATLAGKEPYPAVRLQLASTARRLAARHDVGPLLHALMGHKEDAADPVIPQMIWLAYETKLSGAKSELDWLKDNAAGNALVSDTIVPRMMRRLVATGKPEDLEACVVFLGGLKDATVRRRALEGLVEALQGRLMDGPPAWKGVLAALLEDKDAEVQRLARKVAVSFRDPEAVRRALAVVRDAKRPAGERAEAVRDLGLTRPPEGQKLLLDLLTADGSPELRAEAARALAGYDSAEVPAAVLQGWKGYPPPVRAEAVNLLTGRKEWAAALLDAVGKKDVPRTDLTDSTILRVRAFRDKKLDAQVEAVWGKLRDTPAELNALIDKMRGELYAGRGSFERGRKVFENNCAKCHKFEGKGHEVGPELDGAARDVEYLLVNVLDPNRVIGAPYIEKFVDLKSGRLERGLLAAEDGQSLTLKTENDVKKVILKKDIDEVRDQGKSIMPEGLGNAMSVQDFRDLVRYVMAHPFLTDVAVAGPLPAKETAAIDPANPSAAQGVTWTSPLVGVPGRIALPAAKDDAAAYVRAEVTAPAPVRTRLLLSAGQAVQVWLNGKQVYQAKPGDGPAAPDQAGVEVELQEGANRLLFRLAYRGDKEVFYARLLDPQRKLQHPEAER